MAVSHKPVLGGREQVRVAVVQKAPRFLDREASVGRAEALIAEAAAGGADLVVFLEAWLAGYPYWTEGWDSALGPWVQGRVCFRDAGVLVPGPDTARHGTARRGPCCDRLQRNRQPVRGVHPLQHAALLRS